VVAEPEAGGRKERAELLGSEVERLVVEAMKLGLEQEEVQAAVAAQWEKIAATGHGHSRR
jgi:hypothetical protein